MSLRLRLVCFVVLCALPLLVLSVVKLGQELERVNEAARLSAENAANRLQSQLAHTLAAAQDTALLIAALDLDSPLSGSRCSSILAKSMRSSDSGLLNFVAARSTGDVVCSAQPLTVPVNVGDRPHVKKAVLSGKPVLSDYVVGRITGRGSIQLVAPMQSGSALPNLGIASISAQALTYSAFERVGMPLTVSVFDRSGILVSRYPEGRDIRVGTNFSETELFRQITSINSSAVSSGLDGIKRHFAFRRVDFHGEPALWISSGVDISTLEAAVWNQGVRDFVVVALVLACVAGLAWFSGAPVILARYRGLQEVAKAVKSGDKSVRIDLRLNDELTPVERTLNQMLDSIEKDHAMLADSESNYRMLFEHNLDGVLLTSPNGVILAANPAACQMLQRTSGELKRLNRGAVVDHSDPRLAPLLKRRADTGQARGELRFLRADGSLFEAEVSSSAFLDVGGMQKTCIVVRDLSELRRARMQLMLVNHGLEKTVERRTVELAAAVKELEAFSFSVSHDLRAPLRTVNGFAKVLNEDFGQLLPAKGQHCLNRITAGANKMGRLIDDLLSFSRLGRQEMRACQCDMDRLVREVIEDIASVYPDWRGEVRVGPLPPGHGDTPLLRQLWANLIGNAYKYSAKKAHPVVEICFEQKDGEGVYIVKDNGDGFDMAYAGKLFEVFQRLHTDREFEGTGVGLAIVKRIVERHGGRAWAIGVPNEGATFSFTLGKREAS